MSQAAEQAVGQWVPPEGRKWTMDDAREMAKAFEASGKNLAEFGRGHGLTPERLRWWLKRMGKPSTRGRPSSGGPMVFAPVRLVSAVGRGIASEKTSSVSESTIEVVLVGGRRVRVGTEFDVGLLRRVVAALEDGRC